jgi:hypothetical protein
VGRKGVRISSEIEKPVKLPRASALSAVAKGSMLCKAPWTFEIPADTNRTVHVSFDLWPAHDHMLLGGADTVQTSQNGRIASEQKQEEDAVKLITIHAAKGWEFPVVAIIGLDEGSLPHSRAFEQQEIAEERRLAYVGATRTKQRLYLLRAERRLVFGEWKDTAPSRFLHTLPEHCIIEETYWG